MISFILPKPPKLQWGHPTGWILSITFSHFHKLHVCSKLIIQAPHEEVAREKQPQMTIPHLLGHAGPGLQPGTTQAPIHQHHRTVYEVFNHWCEYQSLSLAQFERDFSTESRLFIWGGGGSPLEKPQLPFKKNRCGRGQDTLRMSLLFSSGQQKTSVTCWTFLHHNKHMLGTYVFLMGWT